MSTDDLHCFYLVSVNFCCLLVHMRKWFPYKSQEVPVLKYLNLHTVQSKHGISFYQTSNIKQTIIDVWFPNPTYLLGVCDTSFQPDTTYEQDIAETLPIPPKDLPCVYFYRHSSSSTCHTT